MCCLANSNFVMRSTLSARSAHHVAAHHGRPTIITRGQCKKKRETIMSPATAMKVGSQGIDVDSSSTESFLRRIADALMQSREQAARRRVVLHLSAMSDGRLGAFGFSAADIESIRAGEPVANILARRARRFD